MVSRVSLSEILEAGREGRHPFPETVERIVNEFYDLPLSEIVCPEMVRPTYERELEIVAKGFAADKEEAMTIPLKELLRDRYKTVLMLPVLRSMARFGFYDINAENNYKLRTTKPAVNKIDNMEELYRLVPKKKQTGEGKFYEKVLPFLTLSIRDYFSYMKRMEKKHSSEEKSFIEVYYNRWLGTDVEIWESIYNMFNKDSMVKSTPTISDVLVRCFDVIFHYGYGYNIKPFPERGRRRPDGGLYHPGDNTYNAAETPLPFQESNCFPPERYEVELAYTRMALLMYNGPFLKK